MIRCLRLLAALSLSLQIFTNSYNLCHKRSSTLLSSSLHLYSCGHLNIHSQYETDRGPRNSIVVRVFTVLHKIYISFSLSLLGIPQLRVSSIESFGFELPQAPKACTHVYIHSNKYSIFKNNVINQRSYITQIDI